MTVLTEGGVMSTTATAFRAGNSVVVALPKSWRSANGVHAGDRMALDDTIDGEITFRKADAVPEPEELDGLIDFLESLPTDDWPWGDGKEDDRALLAERYG